MKKYNTEYFQDYFDPILSIINFESFNATSIIFIMSPLATIFLL